MNKKQELMIIEEESIRDKIYTIREEKVMLDFELAKIYGYSTKAFNQQVKRNLDKFKGYIFQLTSYEVNNLPRSQIVTLNVNNNMRGTNLKYKPYAFTEAGVYMLMTVLKGPLAIEQSRKLITIFKSMKDYLINSNNLVTTAGIIELTNQVYKNTSDISDIKNQLTVVMDNFIDPSSFKEYLIMNGEKLEADVVYHSIYKKAKKSIRIIDDYINIKTFELLKDVDKNIEIDIYSDNVNRLSGTVINDFIEQTKLVIRMHKTFSVYHDRFIIIDNSLLYLSGPSSKDAGNKVGMIIEIKDRNILGTLMNSLSVY